MKKFTFLLFFVSVLAYVQAENVVYTGFSPSTRTLTYYYGVKPSGSNYERYNPGTGGIRFKEYAKKIDIVVIDASMLNVHPTNLSEMFYGGHINITDSLRLVNLKEIRGLENLQTDEAVTLEEMFYGCESLQSIDLSHFNTSKVKTFSSMFYSCAALTSLDLSSFETSAATRMERMFGHCSSLTDLDLSNFNTENVTDMAGMFARCDALETLDISSFNTGNVTNMESMFNSCAVLKTLDISHFDFSKVTRVDHMFQYNHALETIYCNTDFNELTSLENSDVMFGGCFALVGGNGTTYDTSLPKDKTYARPDGLDSKPGYFTAKGVTWNLTDGVLTISGTGPMPDYGYEKAPWFSQHASITSVIIEDGITTIGECAFVNCENIHSVTIPNSVTSIHGGAFSWCTGLLAVTIPNSVTSIGRNAFKDCSSLTEITSEATTPPTLGSTVFDGVTNTIPVYVPAGSVAAYKAASGWNYFENIQAKGAGTKEIYAALSGSTMTIYYDDQKASRANVIEGWTPKNGTSGMESEQEKAITLAELDASMQDAHPTSTYLWFGRLKNMTDIVHLDYLNTSEVTDMSSMFMRCSSLTSLDLHNFNTSSVVDMNGMFSICSALTSLDVSGFNTSSVVDMSGMFAYCSSLTSLDVSNFNTANVTNMNDMFDGCTSLTSLDVSNFNTSSVMDMGTMFYDCSSLTKLDLSSFNTSSVTGMSTMFSECSALTSLDLSGFNTTNVTVMDGMFFGCSSLTKLDVSGFDVSHVTNMNSMFYGCSSLTSLNLSNFNTDKVENMSYMFYGCSSLTSLNVSSFNTASVMYMTGMFNGCSSLTSLDLSNFNTDKVEGMSYMFDGCSSLTSLNLSNFNTANVANMSYMFFDCSSLTSLDVSGFNTAWVTDLKYMFAYCSSLTSLDVSGFDVSHVWNMSHMFEGCSSLKTIYCDEDWSTSSSDDMFDGCTALVGGMGTKYDAGVTDATYARPDGLDDQPGYFTSTPYTGEALIDGIRYYLSGDDMTAEVMPLGDGYYAGDIVLPEKVSYLKNDYAVTSVAGAAFSNCPELLSVTIPKSVNWIEPEVFYNSPKLTAVNVAAANADYSSFDGVLFNKAQTELRAYPTAKEGAYIVPEGVETIMDATFAENKKLTAVTLPASLYEIASRAFENCTGLEMIACRATAVPSLGSDVFVGVNKAIPVFVPKANIALYKAEYGWEDFTNYIAIEDKEAADAVIAKINAIGTVTYTPECKARIDAARGGYDALTAEQKVYITDAAYKILTDAEKAYADLKAKAEADQAAASAVIGKIDAIGTVTLESEAAILDARSAYNALTAAQQALVTNYSVLTAAEAKLEILKKQAESDEAAAKAVTDLINAIGTVTYTSESKARIDAAREAYDALTAAQKALVTNLTTLTAAEKAYADLKAKAEADQAAANIVIGKINAIGTVTYTPESKALIDAAREAYDALTDAQKGLVSAATYKILTDAEQTYADLKKKADADQAAANIVIGKINAIGTVTLSSEAAILDARSAYDALTAAQQVLVTNYGVLTAAEKAYADLKAKAEADQAAANAVIVKIDAIGTVTLSSEAAITAARSAYNALTADQKALVTNLSTLTAAEAALDQLKKQAAADQTAANIVISKISAIGTVEYTTESKARIDAAREAYDGLTAAQKVLVTNYGVLTAAEKAYADLKAKAEADQAAANAVIVKIDAIGEVTLASEPAIVAARSAYNALTAAQQALVTNLSTLTAAEAKLEILKKQAEGDEAAANAVTGLISAIGTVEYTSESKARIDAAREAYDALTDAQKGLVTNYGVLTVAEQAYADLKKKADADQAAANAVISKIDAIGTVTLSSEAAITAARSAYDALTPAQQALVTNYGTLLSAEATLELLKHQAETDQAAANAVIAKIDAIGTITLESEAAINAARSAYDALTATQKLLVTNLGVLTAAEKKLAELKANAEAVANAKLQLKNIVSQANELKMVAMLYAPTVVTDIDAIINDAQSTIDDPNATVDQVNAKVATLTDNLNTLAVNLLDQAKEQLKQSLRDLYQPGDYPSWYASVVIPALDQVDGITWDFSKSVQDNILYFQVTGQNLYNATKAALEALRGTDKRSIISSCAFTGFENGIKADMTWNISALNDLINTLNASVAAEPYRLDAEMSSLGKWDPVNKELIILDPYEAQKLTAGDYQFITAVKIDGEEAKQYRLPKATEEVLSVTVDAAVWSVDLSGIVIDANYSYTFVTSPMFTVSKSEDVELINEDQLKTQKIYHNGHFYILRGEHIYDIRGTLVR